VTRQDAKGEPAGGWYPKQRLTLDEAIAAFTTGAAYAEFAEAERGTIAVGRIADLTVFDRPITPDHSLLETKVAMTIVGGEIVHGQGALASARHGTPVPYQHMDYVLMGPGALRGP
jgi:predicted amidohydrolase YtcJ